MSEDVTLIYNFAKSRDKESSGIYGKIEEIKGMRGNYDQSNYR